MRRTLLILAAILAAIVMACTGVSIAAYNTGLFGIYGCTHSDREFGDRIAQDPGMQELLVHFPTHEEPQQGCDDDDHSVSVDGEFVTGMSKKAAFAEAAKILEHEGWTASTQRPDCFDKQVDGQSVMADLSFRSEFRTNASTDLLVGFLRIATGCAHD